MHAALSGNEGPCALIFDDTCRATPKLGLKSREARRDSHFIHHIKGHGVQLYNRGRPYHYFRMKLARSSVFGEEDSTSYLGSIVYNQMDSLK